MTHPTSLKRTASVLLAVALVVGVIGVLALVPRSAKAGAARGYAMDTRRLCFSCGMGPGTVDEAAFAVKLRA